MGRIMAIDYGLKRTGVAVTDPLKIIANPLDTVASNELLPFLAAYMRKEEVESIVVGDPRNLDNTPSQISGEVNRMVETLRKTFPGITVKTIDERFTSKIAQQTILASGVNKKRRRDKSLVDKISAVIILQSFLETI